MKRLLLSCLLLILAGAWNLSAQVLWPGDVNNNGIVNGVDLLYWGVANGNAGPARPNASTAWQAQTPPAPWPLNFPGGPNYAYADTDGDGFVDDADIDAIEDNFGLSHSTPQPDGYASGPANAAPRLRLRPDMEVVGEGALVNIALLLDDAAFPIEDFYGIAFKLTYSTGFLAGDDGPDFDLAENSWLTTTQEDVEVLFIDNDGQGKAELAITRTDQQQVAVGEQVVGNFSIVIEDIILGLTVDTFRLGIDSIRLINKDFSSILVAPDTATVIVAKDPVVVSTRPDPSNGAFRLYPNPAGRQVFVESEQPLFGWRLATATGTTQPLPVKANDEGHYQLRLPDLPPGTYWLLANSPQGVLIRPLILYDP